MSITPEQAWPCGPKTNIWPAGEMPHRQAHQIAATTEEAAAPDFDADSSREPHIQWYPAPDPAVATDSCAIVISGGGYEKCCDLEAYRPLVAELLGAGIHCVNFTYRTPRPRGMEIYRTAWDDGWRAVRLVRREAAKRGIDPGKIGAMACSAGSHLALLLALRSLGPAPYEPIDAMDREPAPLAWLLAMCPAYLLSDGLAGQNANRGEGAALDPVFTPDAAACPVCFFHGSADPYSPLGSTALWRVLSQRGIKAELHLDAGRGHGPIGGEAFRRHALGFLMRIGALPGASLRAVEEWEQARRRGAPHDLHL